MNVVDGDAVAAVEDGEGAVEELSVCPQLLSLPLSQVNVVNAVIAQKLGGVGTPRVDSPHVRLARREVVAVAPDQSVVAEQDGPPGEAQDWLHRRGGFE